MSLTFEPVKLGPKAKKEKKKQAWKHVGKTLLYMAGGALISLTYLHFTEGPIFEIHQDEISNAAFIGAFIGFFITNSPCAKGRC